MTKLDKKKPLSFILLFLLLLVFQSSNTAVAVDDSRLITFLGNWQSCPTTDQLEQYTHIVVSFATTYTWDPIQNICNTNCRIHSPVSVCENGVNQHLVDEWRAAGKRVLLSFGGAGMGGSWAGDVNNCWDYCFDKANRVVNRLVEIVMNQNFDGVDIDYEYFYNTEAQQNFLRDITTGLKDNLPEGQNIVTHAPMDSDLVQGSAYYNILKDESASIDFIMPQYYNGMTRPALDGFTGSGAGSVSASSHYDKLVNDLFDNEPERVVFGFCISDCYGSADGAQASQVMSEVAEFYPCNGGAFSWVVEEDTDGEWSKQVSSVVRSNSGCSMAPTPTPPTPTPPTPTSPTSPSSCHTDTHMCGPNNPCSDGLCCSQWGYCGVTEAHCGSCCQSNCWGAPVTSSLLKSPIQVPTKAPVTLSPTKAPLDPSPSPPSRPSSCMSITNQCGPNKPCRNGRCCSQWGWCGRSDAHCNECCQSNCGN